jgi:voltage-gated potassium channel Kch
VDSTFARAARSASAPLVVGDPEHEKKMRGAGVEGTSACGVLDNADLVNLHVALELQELALQAKIVLRLFNTSLASAIRSLVGNVTVLSPTELAVPAFIEATLRGSAAFKFRVGDRRVAVQEVESDDRRLRLALAEAESTEGEPGLFSVEAPRVLGIVDRGRTVETRQTSPEPIGDLDARIARRGGRHRPGAGGARAPCRTAGRGRC